MGIQSKFLLLTMAALELAYQGMNWREQKYCQIAFENAPAPIVLGSAAGPWLRFPRLAIQKRGGSCDGASKFVEDWGHLARYYLGQRHERLLEGAPTPFVNLFYREELPYLFERIDTKEKQHSLDEMKDLSRRLREAGVKVTWLPLPSKTLFERERLPNPLPADRPWGAETLTYAVRTAPFDATLLYRDWVDRSEGFAVDLHGVYSEYRKQHPGADLYIPYDNHWTSLGIAVAAHALLAANSRIVGLPEYSGQRTENLDHYLLALLGLPRVWMEKSAGFHWVESLYRLPVAHDPEPGRVIVAGTSQSRRFQTTEYSLAGQLGRATGRSLVEIGLEGGGVWGALNQLATSGFRFQPGDLFVWEFPDWSDLSPKPMPDFGLSPVRALSGGR